ncbi:MAG: hypothetical protein RLZZ180_237, partial [Pseudomonadota bacterium]
MTSQIQLGPVISRGQLGFGPSGGHRPGGPVGAAKGARLRPSLLAVAAALVLSACGTIQPDPLVAKSMKDATAADTKTIRDAVEPFTRPLSLSEAVARAL